MNKQTLSRAKLVFLLVPLTLAVLALACGGSATIPITLSEEDVNLIIQNSTVTSGPDDLLVEVSSVDMQDGFIRINGTYEREDGTIVPGSCDLALTAQDGMLEAEITAVNISGIDLNDKRITRINDTLTKEFAKSASDTGEVEFTSVTITEDALTFVIKITPSQ
ncbi:MAG: hypothetical protein GY832_44345 [Chloroflexi bacterium]|nr:hypothetical protein [Chloroflexota bacterium]